MAAGIVQFLKARSLQVASVVDTILGLLALAMKLFQTMEPVCALVCLAFQERSDAEGYARRGWLIGGERGEVLIGFLQLVRGCLPERFCAGNAVEFLQVVQAFRLAAGKLALAALEIFG